ncbi:MAG: ribonuclease HI [bacterium]
MTDKVIIFSDGASKGNPGPGGWGAIVVVGDRVVELGGFDKHTTNNRMELTGALEALSLVDKQGVKENIVVNTDSKYVINGMTGWVFGWQKNGWQTKNKEDVSNRDLWEKLATAAQGKKIKWNYVGGHIGVAGNERCDEIASGLALGEKVKLFAGKISDYKIDIHNVGHDTVKKIKKTNSNAKAYSYVSLVGGVVYKDATWAECERRVKGVKGVKFQKSVSPENEEEIIKSWRA